MFYLDKEQETKINTWIKNHEKSCNLSRLSAIGGAYTYLFTPHSLGVTVEVKCACNKKIDVTDYEMF